MGDLRPHRSRLLVALAVLASAGGLTACGGEQVSADEVTASPPELTIPEGSDGGGAAASATPEADASATPDADATATPGASDDTSSSTSGDSATTQSDSGSSTGTGATTGGTQAPSSAATAAPQQDSAQSDSPPAAGSGAEKFEEFCQQNAGAC